MIIITIEKVSKNLFTMTVCLGERSTGPPLEQIHTFSFCYHERVSPPIVRERLQKSNKQKKKSNRESSISRQLTQLKPSACPGFRPLAEVSPVSRHFKPPNSFRCWSVSQTEEKLPLRSHLNSVAALICCYTMVTTAAVALNSATRHQ